MHNDWINNDSYRFLDAYASENHLSNTASALCASANFMMHAAEHSDSRFGIESTHRAYFRHALAVCRMLIDLHIPLSKEEEDTLLAASVCHILPENVMIPNLKSFLVKELGLSETIYEIIHLIFRENDGSEADQAIFYNRIQQNKLALLIKLADRGNLVEQLYGISAWTARSYIHETKAFFLPMCIYAKMHYPELIAPISIMMEKMRCLTEVSEIILSRYEAREAELTHDILQLQEENAMLQSMIANLQAMKSER